MERKISKIGMKIKRIIFKKKNKRIKTNKIEWFFIFLFILVFLILF